MGNGKIMGIIFRSAVYADIQSIIFGEKQNFVQTAGQSWTGRMVNRNDDSRDKVR